MTKCSPHNSHLTDLRQCELYAPDFALASEPILAAKLQLRVETLLLEGPPGSLECLPVCQVIAKPREKSRSDRINMLQPNRVNNERVNLKRLQEVPPCNHSAVQASCDKEGSTLANFPRTWGTSGTFGLRDFRMTRQSHINLSCFIPRNTSLEDRRRWGEGETLYGKHQPYIKLALVRGQ